MYLLVAGPAGLLAALFIHWVTWYARLNHLSVTTVLGVLSALGLTGFFLLYLTSDIFHIVRIAMVIIWAVALAVGSLQAGALKAPWWKGVAAVFFEMALAFLIGAAVNLTMQRYLGWLEQQFPGIPVYPMIDWFLRALALTLLVLAMIRPLVRLSRLRSLS